jgi:hypothetical protein
MAKRRCRYSSVRAPLKAQIQALRCAMDWQRLFGFKAINAQSEDLELNIW